MLPLVSLPSSSRGPRPAPSARRRSRRPTKAPAAFVESRVTFEGVDGEQLVGTLRAPPAESAADAAIARETPPRPLALLAHGYMSDRDASVLLRLADALEQRLSMPSLRWDFSGNGESEGRFRYGGYRREAQEIASAAAFARAHGYRVALLAGHSKGATSVLVYAGGVATDNDDDYDYAVVNVAGRFDVAEGVERRLGARALAALSKNGRVDRMPGRRRTSEAFEWTLYREDLEDRLSTDVGAFCEGARLEGKARVLSLHCEGDADVPVGEAARFHKALGGDAAGHRLVVLPGGDHSFRTPESSEVLVAEVVAWAEKVAAAEAAAG